MPSSRTHLNISDIDFGKLVLKEPKKQDDLFYCRFQYDSCTKVFVTMNHVKLARIKSISSTSHMVSLKLPLACTRPLMDLEEFIVETTKEHCAQWFNNALTPSLVEEYFSSNFTVDKKLGDIYKFMVQVLPFASEQEQESAVAKHGDLVLQLLGVRFYKKKFSLIWSLESFQPYEIRSDSDDDHIPLDEDDDLFDPDMITSMKQDLLDKANAYLARYKEKCASLETCIDQLAHAPLNFTRLESISEAIENAGVV